LSADYRRRLTWRPTDTQAGSYTVDFTASDGTWTETQQLPITVVDAQ
jgi:hypothetical protein